MKSHILLKLMPFLIGMLIFFFLTLSGMVERILAGTLILDEAAREGAVDGEEGVSEVLKSSLEDLAVFPANSGDFAGFSGRMHSDGAGNGDDGSPVFRHSLEKGWKISLLAEEYDISPRSLISLNGFRGFADLEDADSIMVPRIDGFRIQWDGGGGVSEIARYYGTDSSMVWLVGNKGDYFVSGASRNIPGSSLNDVFLFPVSGDIIRGFGEGFDYITGIPYNSEGINISVESGTYVRASRPGRIIKTGQHDSYGLYVMLEHSDDWMSFYAHFKRVDVAPGDRINQLDVLGLAGDSGIARSAQLHFALIYRKQAVDPLDYLR